MDEQPPTSPSEPSGHDEPEPRRSSTGSHPAPAPPPTTDTSLLHVDPGAMALASLAAAAAFIVTGRSWDALSSGVGISLLVILFAHHRAWRGRLTIRGLLQRLTFAGTATLAFLIAIAWPVQDWISHQGNWEGWNVVDIWSFASGDMTLTFQETMTVVTTGVLAYLWPVFTTAVFVIEPRISMLLERPAPSWRQMRRRLRRGRRP